MNNKYLFFVQLLSTCVTVLVLHATICVQGGVPPQQVTLSPLKNFTTVLPSVLHNVTESHSVTLMQAQTLREIQQFMKASQTDEMTENRTEVMTSLLKKLNTVYSSNVRDTPLTPQLALKRFMKRFQASGNTSGNNDVEVGVTETPLHADMDVSVHNESVSAADHYTLMYLKYQKIIDFMLESSGQTALKLLSKAKVKFNCVASLLAVVRGLRNFDDDAWRFFDYSGKLAYGVFDGNFFEPGEYEACLNYRSRDNSGFRGQYCSVTVSPHMPRIPPKRIRPNTFLANPNLYPDASILQTFVRDGWGMYAAKQRVGLCVPDTCDHIQLQRAISAFSSMFHVNATVINCETSQEISWNPLQITVLTILSLFVGVVLAATIMERMATLGGIHSLPNSFNVALTVSRQLSAYRNVQEIFTVSAPNKNTASYDLQHFNGLRVVLTLWVIAAHTAIFANMGTYEHLVKFVANAELPLWQIINNPWLNVDAFYLISGFLVMFSQLKNNRNKSSNFSTTFSKAIVSRIWRLIPVAMIVMSFVFVLPNLGSGPIWNEQINKEVNNCKQRWWSILTHTNNFNGIDHICLLHYWYISVDIQIYAVMLLLSMITVRKPRLAVYLFSSLMLIIHVVLVLQYLINDYESTVFVFGRDIKIALDQLNHIFLYPHPHVIPYVVGAITGYLYVKHRNAQLATANQIMLWIGSIFLLTFVLMMPSQWGSGRAPAPLWLATVYGTFHRVAWSIGIAWIIFACSSGKGGFLNSILSSKAFSPLGKISYSIYLTHAYVIFYRSWTVTQRIESSHLALIARVISNFVFSIITGLIVAVFIEKPLNLFWDSVIGPRLVPAATKTTQSEVKLSTSNTVVSSSKA